MPVIHIETNVVAKDEYEFIQTLVVGAMNVEERTFQEPHEDRMYAAMTNLGYACKWYADQNITRGEICIVTDKDGKDQRYAGEHDDLFKAIHSQKDYDHNRAKYALIYGRHVKFLDRIRELANTYETVFTQNANALDDIRCGNVEFTERAQDDSPFLIRNRTWTRENIVRLSLNGTHNKVICMACQKSIQYNQTDNFTPFSQLYYDQKGLRRTVLIKSNKQLVKNFIETHLGMHTNNYVKKAKNKTV